MTTTAQGETGDRGLFQTLVTGYERTMAWAIRHERAAVLAALLLAVLVRVLYMALCVGLDSPPTYDGQRYDSFALRILAGQGYRTELGLTASKPPLYPFFVAGAYWLFGPSNVVALRLLQAALDGLTCVLVYLLGKSLAGRGVGLLAAGGAAVYPLSLYMSALLYPESLFLFLFVAWLLLFVEMVRSGRIRMGVVSGILFGLCVLARPNIALLVPFAALFPFFMRKPAGAWRLALGFLAAIVVTILPWSVRNFLVFGEFVPLTTEGGGVFWADNHPLAEGGTVLPTSETWYQDDNPPDLLWSGWSSLGEPESSRRFSQAGLRWVKTHPGDFLALVPKKIARLWGPASFSTQSDRRAGALTMLLWVPYLPFMALVVVGLVVSLGKWRHWSLMYALILSTNLAAAIFSGGTRYSMPMVPALLVFCALGLSAVLARLSGTSFEGARQEHSV